MKSKKLKLKNGIFDPSSLPKSKLQGMFLYYRNLIFSCLYNDYYDDYSVRAFNRELDEHCEWGLSEYQYVLIDKEPKLTGLCSWSINNHIFAMVVFNES